MNRVTVVGGGIAGLALAAALDERRWTVTVVEARPDRPPAGTALAMWPSAMAALDRAGAGEAVRRRAVPLTGLTGRDGQGRTLARAPAPEGLLVTRPDLLAALRDAVPGSATQVVSTVRDPQLLAEETAADLLVGADGAHSVVRQTLWPGTSARRVGYLALRGISPEPVEGMAELWEGSRICGLSAIGDGLTNWYLSGRITERWPAGEGAGARATAHDVDSWDDEHAHAVAVAAASGFGAEASAVVAATSPNEVLRQELWTVPRLGSWHGHLDTGRRQVPAVLVGDAAHAMCPNLGRGACESLVDAAALAAMLDSGPRPDSLSPVEIAAALASFGRLRRRPARRIQVASRALLAFSTLRHGQAARNAGIRMLTRRAETRRQRHTSSRGG